jgi:hypothetical protein
VPPGGAEAEAAEQGAQRFGVGGGQFGEGEGAGDDGAGGAASPAVSSSRVRDRMPSTAVRRASACRKTSLNTSRDSGPV